MPELPEVETTVRGVRNHLEGRVLTGWTVREPRLRWPVTLPETLAGTRIERVGRRAKYVIVELGDGALILHLGMSGSLRLVRADAAAGKHDHVDLHLDSGWVLRLTDPRRFGSLHYHGGAPEEHWLLASLGPEPLGNEFHGAYLHAASRKRRVPVKSYIMDSSVVVGVGNIYANEALFAAGIRPRIAAGRVSRARYDALAVAIRELEVYGRQTEPCRVCSTPLTGIRMGQRATVYCARCQS
jgi:formamidopyrimidine-DNA glycosylase